MQKRILKNSQKLLKTIRDHYGITSDEDLYYHIACDEISLSPEEMRDIYKGRSSIIKKLLRNPFSSKKDDGKNSGVRQEEEAPAPINRKEVYVLHPDLDKPNYLVEPCCNPIPGDDVLGFVNSDEQVVLHKVSCSKAMRLKSSYGPRLVATRWGEIAERFTVVIAAEGIDRQGVLEDIIAAEDDPVGALKIAIRSQDDVDIFAQHQYAVREALCLCSDVPELLEGALRVYQGRAFYDGTGGLERAEPGPPEPSVWPDRIVNTG